MQWLTEGAEYRERYYGISKDDAVGAFIKHTTGTYQRKLKTPWNSRPEHQHVAHFILCKQWKWLSNYLLIPMKKKFAADNTPVGTAFILYNSTSLLGVQLMSPSFFFSLSLYHNYRDWKSVNSTLLLPKTPTFCTWIHITSLFKFNII